MSQNDTAKEYLVEGSPELGEKRIAAKYSAEKVKKQASITFFLNYLWSLF
jgi:hypothetical protein